MSGGLVDDGEGYEEEGVEAFNRMADAMQGLQSRLGTFDSALGGKVAQAERAATKAETAAGSAQRAAEQAEATARQDARQAASWAILGAVAGLLAAGGAGYWLGHASGREGGQADGYRIAMDEKAAAAWANTPAGQLALAMDRAGDLNLVARCAGHGWKQATQDGRRVCYPNPLPDRTVYGWNLP